MRVVVTGGRDFWDKTKVYEVLDSLEGVKVLAQGGASGADMLSKAWARSRGVSVREFPADWEEFGRSAGPRRNRAMLQEVNPDLVVAFPGGRGTANCVETAKSLGFEVREIS